MERCSRRRSMHHHRALRTVPYKIAPAQQQQGQSPRRKEPKTYRPIHPCRNRSGHNPSGHNPSGHKNHTPSIVPAPHAVAATPQNSRPDNARQTWSGTQTPVNAPAATIRPPENHIVAATYLFYHKILYDMQIKMEVPRYFSTFADRID